MQKNNFGDPVIQDYPQEDTDVTLSRSTTMRKLAISYDYIVHLQEC